MADDSTAGGLQAAENRIRETAKWLTVSVAGIGTLLAGGTQLSSLGTLDADSHRLAIAEVSGGIAVAMAAAILVLTVWIMATPARSLSEVINNSPRGLGATLTSADYLDGHASADALQTALTQAIADRDTKYTAAYAANPPNQAANAAAEAADARAVYLSGVVHKLLGVVRYRNLAFRWRVAGSGIVIAAIVAAGAMGVFAWAVNPPDDVKASVATPNVLTAPQRAHITLTAAGKDALKQSLGTQCDTSKPIEGLILGATDAGPDVLIEAQSGCKATRFVAVPDWASVVR